MSESTQRALIEERLKDKAYVLLSIEKYLRVLDKLNKLTDLSAAPQHIVDDIKSEFGL